MKRTWVAVLGLCLLASRSTAGEPPVLGTPKEKASYTVGVDTARNLRRGEIDVDLDLLVRGLKDGLTGGKLLMTEQELAATRNGLQREIMRRQAAKKAPRARSPKAPGEERTGPTAPAEAGGGRP